MRAYHVVISDTAGRDVFEIQTFHRGDSPGRATDFTLKLSEKIESLVDIRGGIPGLRARPHWARACALWW